MSVIHLRKELAAAPAAAEVPGVMVRHMAVPEDVPVWLALRERAVADLQPRPRPWMHADFQREMFDRPWWHAQCTWLAIAGELRLAGETSCSTPARRSSPARGDAAQGSVIGAVTLAMRERAAARVPVVHWLLVDPAWRRRGVGRLLLATLERAAWDAGFREVQLETHAAWTAAAAFYPSMGYAPLGELPPR